jgi:hypothetical protein
MKKNIITVLTLFLITSMSGLLLSVFNNLTSERIEKNNLIKIEKVAKNVFDDTNTINVIEIKNNEVVNKKIECLDINEKVIGYLYQANGNNSFGSISLLVAIKDDLVISVDFLKLDQSYGKIAKENTNKIYNTNDGLLFDVIKNYDDIELKCGATSSSTLIQNLVLECIKVYGDSNEG